MEKRAEYRDAVITLLVMGVLLWFLPFTLTILAFSALFVLLFFHRTRRVNHLVWTRINHILQSIMHPVLFSLIYFLILVPLGLLFQRMQKRKMPTQSNFKTIKQTVENTFFDTPW